MLVQINFLNSRSIPALITKILPFVYSRLISVFIEVITIIIIIVRKVRVLRKLYKVRIVTYLSILLWNPDRQNVFDPFERA